MSCGGGSNSIVKLDRKIKSILRNDNAITEQEAASLKDYITANADDFADCGCTESDADLKAYILEVAETRRNNPGAPEIEGLSDDGGSTDSRGGGDLSFKLYMESSASMYPYTKSSTEFKSAIYDLLTSISDNGDEKGLINYIGSVMFPVSQSVSDFIKKRDPYDVAKQNKAKINTKNTDLNKIIQMIFEEGDDDAISILVSDCIYSVQGNDAKDGLTKVKYVTKDVIQEHAKDYSVLVMQLNSDYNGTYYPYSGGRIKYKGKRPYYMLFIGKSSKINTMLTNKKYAQLQDFKNLDGFQNYHLFDATGNEKVHYSVLPTTNKEGRYRIDNDHSDRNFVHGLKEMTPSRGDDGRIQMSVAVDLSGVLVEESYKISPRNYTIDAEDDFSIEDIEEVDNVGRSDKKYLGDATHIITISIDKVMEKEQTLELAFKKVLPKWIKNSSTDDDRKVGTDDDLEDKTFGLEYLMEGFDEGYHSNIKEPTYFKIRINIKK